ncbi:MAG: MGMT family protein [Candidatus Paceibacterota bacterium]|jgi:O-6-methylguanine DNA methyltransferase
MKQKKSFTDRVFAAVKKIPRGNVLTYQQVAHRAGNAKACRAVGNILSRNFDPTIPCHRVVRSNGTVGGYNRGNAVKIKKLRAEGVTL